MKRLLKKLSIVMLLICLTTGCGNPLKKMTKSTLYIEKNGKVQSLSVESFEKEYYTEEGLKTFIEKEITTQQKERGEDSVCMKAFEVKEKKAVLQLQFASIDDYQRFTDIEIKSGQYQKMIGKEYKVSTIIENETQEKKKLEQIENLEELHYILLKDPEGIQLLFDNQVKYCSENVTILDKNLVSIPADEQCFILYEVE